MRFGGFTNKSNPEQIGAVIVQDLFDRLDDSVVFESSIIIRWILRERRIYASGYHRDVGAHIEGLRCRVQRLDRRPATASTERHDPESHANMILAHAMRAVPAGVQCNSPCTNHFLTSCRVRHESPSIELDGVFLGQIRRCAAQIPPAKGHGCKSKARPNRPLKKILLPGVPADDLSRGNPLRSEGPRFAVDRAVDGQRRPPVSVVVQIRHDHRHFGPHLPRRPLDPIPPSRCPQSRRIPGRSISVGLNSSANNGSPICSTPGCSVLLRYPCASRPGGPS